jgi:hypothetical protein
VELTTGVWTEVAFSAVSAATPAIITITDPGGDGLETVNYKILYVPTEDGWCTFPARVAETPLRVSSMIVNLGGTWNGSAFAGGKLLTSEVQSVDWTCNNNMAIEFVPGGGNTYASRAFRNGRVQTLRFNREFRDYILQQLIDDNDTFGVYLKAVGPLLTGDLVYYFQVEVIFPKCGVVNAPQNVDGKRIMEAGDLRVMEHATYGSVIAYVQNMQATYAA